MYVCIKISTKLELVTGMHIGASSEFSEIGAVDSPVIKDPSSNLPIIPGSSLKGKMRTLLARKYNEGGEIHIENDNDKIKRIFGSSGNDNSMPSRAIFYDNFVDNASINKDSIDKNSDELIEIKFENNIDRVTCEANPRQIERVIKGTEFNVNIMYEYYTKTEEAKTEEVEIAEIATDLKYIIEGMYLLKNNYLGGNGSRGYGQVKFDKEINLNIIECYNGNENKENMCEKSKELEEKLKEAGKEIKYKEITCKFV